MCKEERNVLQEVRDIDECAMDEFGSLDNSEKTMAILGDRKGVRLAKKIDVMYENNVMSAQTLEVSLLGVGTVLRLERDAWSIVK